MTELTPDISPHSSATPSSSLDTDGAHIPAAPALHPKGGDGASAMPSMDFAPIDFGESQARKNHMPHPDFEQDGRLKIVITGLDKNVRTSAIEAANEMLSDKIGDEDGFKQFLGRIWQHGDFSGAKEAFKSVGRNAWYGNMAREYYLTKYTREAEKAILEHENILHHKGISAEAYRLQTTLRFAYEYDEMVHEEAGEHRHKMFDRNEDGSVNQEGAKLKSEIFGLIESYANGSLTSDDAFEEEKKRTMTRLVKDHPELKQYIGECQLYTDNLLQIAQNVKAEADARQAAGEDYDIQGVLQQADLITGEAKLGARTEVEYSRTERLMKKMESTRIPVNETTVATALSASLSIAGWATKGGLSAASAMTIAPGALGGVWAGLREKRMLKEERAQHAREMAVGGIDPTTLNRRRELLEESRYETKEVKDIIEQLGLLYDDKGKLRIDSPARYDEALNIIAETESRIKLSDLLEEDLLSYSGHKDMAGERTALDLARAKIKVDIRDMLMNGDPADLAKLGVSNSELFYLRFGKADAVDQVLAPRVEAMNGMLREEMGQKDRIQKKLERKEISKAVLVGTAFGFVSGSVGQEIHSLMTSGQQGLIEGALGANKNAGHETFLKGAFFHREGIASQTSLTMPRGFKMTDRHGNSFSIVGPDGKHVDNLQLNDSGTLTKESELRLQKFGQLSREGSAVATEVQHQRTVSGKEWVRHHKDLTNHVKRDFWYDHGTSASDLEELDLNDPRMDSKGNIIIHFNGASSSASLREAARNGDIKLTISASADTQHQVVMTKFNEDNNAVIAKDSPVARLFKGKGDNVHFMGKYMEVVEDAGKDSNGVTHIRPMATQVGEGHRTFTDIITVKATSPQTNYVFTPHNATGGSEPGIVSPLFTPFRSRSGLNRLRNVEPVPESDEVRNEGARRRREAEDAANAEDNQPTGEESASQAQEHRIDENQPGLPRGREEAQEATPSAPELEATPESDAAGQENGEWYDKKNRPFPFGLFLRNFGAQRGMPESFSPEAHQKAAAIVWSLIDQKGGDVKAVDPKKVLRDARRFVHPDTTNGLDNEVIRLLNSASSRLEESKKSKTS